MSFADSALLAAWIVLILLGLGFAGLMGQMADLRHAIHGHRDGSTEALENPALLDVGKHRGLRLPALILFADSKCAACREVVPAFLEEPETAGYVSTIALKDHAWEGLNDAGSGVTVISSQSELFESMGVVLTPTLAAFDASGAVEWSRAVPSGSHLRDLVRSLSNA